NAAAGAVRSAGLRRAAGVADGAGADRAGDGAVGLRDRTRALGCRRVVAVVGAVDRGLRRADAAASCRPRGPLVDRPGTRAAVSTFERKLTEAAELDTPLRP